MIPFKEFLTERMSSVVYHVMDGGTLGLVLDSNTFILNQASNTEADEREYKLAPERKNHKGTIYFMSVARNLSSNFPRRSMHGEVILVLDGNAISNKYRAEPVDYFRGSRAFRRKEAEDRLIHNKPTIKDFNKYIKKNNGQC